MAENYHGICFITVAPEARVVRLPRAEQLISPDKEREFFGDIKSRIIPIKFISEIEMTMTAPGTNSINISRA
jgi:hypothetical protein